MKPFIHLILSCVLLLSFNAVASDRPDHYKGKPANTLAEAVANFSEYNARLAAILTKDSLSPQDMDDIHQLTYTLENALDRINDAMDDLEDTLEVVHKASERAEVDIVKIKAKAYLDTATQVVK